MMSGRVGKVGWLLPHIPSNFQAGVARKTVFRWIGQFLGLPCDPCRLDLCEGGGHFSLWLSRVVFYRARKLSLSGATFISLQGQHQHRAVMEYDQLGSSQFSERSFHPTCHGEVSFRKTWQLNIHHVNRNNISTDKLHFIELDDGKIYRKASYLMVKTMVSCRFSLKPTQWYLHLIFPAISRFSPAWPPGSRLWCQQLQSKQWVSASVKDAAEVGDLVIKRSREKIPESKDLGAPKRF